MYVLRLILQVSFLFRNKLHSALSTVVIIVASSSLCLDSMALPADRFFLCVWRDEAGASLLTSSLFRIFLVSLQKPASHGELMTGVLSLGNLSVQSTVFCATSLKLCSE